MSHYTYDEQWAEAQNILEDCTYADSVLISSKPSKDKKLLRKQIGIILTKYIFAINNLAESYDMIVHPQKRLLIRKILDASIIRYLELKQDLVNLVSSEYVYLTDAMVKIGLLPYDVELQIPECYKKERNADLNWKNNFIENTLANIGMKKEETPDIHNPMTREEAILFIQRHEKARQYKIQAQFMPNIETKESIKTKQDEEISDISLNSALKIQRFWRGFITRRKIRKRVMEEMLLIGMLQPDHFPTEEKDFSIEIKAERYKLQTKHEAEYQVALVQEKEYIKKYQGNIIMEEIRDELRDWYLTYKQQTGKFPIILPEELGGSAAIIKQRSVLIDRSEEIYSNAPPSIDGKSSKGKTSDNLQEEKKRKVNEDDDEGFKLSCSKILTELEAANTEYEDWKDLDESNNPEQTFDTNMIKTQKMAEVEAELRKIIDDQIRVELEDLQAALERDQKGKKTKKQNKKKKARRIIKKSKKKKDKDLTPERTLESLFEELVVNGIIRKYPFTPLYSFKGEISYAGYNNHSQEKNILPSLGDIRQVIRDYCILPLCSIKIREIAPLVKSFLIAGPKGCGKDMLVHAVCSEIGAVLFDLSAANIVGKYPGKLGLMMLIHLVNKVSKLLQPSIIYIDDAEKMFLKKVPKTDKTDPKRLKKDISKIVKSIGPSDLVMLIGVTHSPWECDQKSLMQTYNRLILMLRPDHASVNSIWRDLLLQYDAFNRELNICVLSILSDGYTVGTLYKVMQRLMTCKRFLRLKIDPLKLNEILEVLSLFEPIYKEEEDLFIQWYAKTPLRRNQLKALEFESTESESEREIIK